MQRKKSWRSFQALKTSDPKRGAKNFGVTALRENFRFATLRKKLRLQCMGIKKSATPCGAKNSVFWRKIKKIHLAALG